MNTRCVFTNTLPTGPYRGAGRPEASYLLERVIDAAADATGIDAAELRRRNLIKPEQDAASRRPSATPTTAAIFPPSSSARSNSSTMRALPRARRRRRRRGKLRGLGIGCYLEIAGAFPEEAARISFPGGKQVMVSIGAGASGQGHRTVFGKVAARRLGIAPDAVTVTSGDSARDVPGFGAVASRSAM